ncbi:MAG: hypothetical protein PHC70_01810 [Patescibacteria group bacterium]|nr:hypothetical protein [Patescibacteria group bacterium]
MEEHLSQILKLVIDQAIQTGEPVGSQSLVEQFDLKVSPATVRNYFMELEESGFIMQPHTSSGRLPTEKGYKFYLQNLMKPKTLSKKETNELAEAAKFEKEDHHRVKALAKAMAELAQNASVVGIGSMDSYYTGLSNLFAQPEFKDWNRIVSISDILDRMDDVLGKLRHVRFDEPTTLIGSECPFGSMCGSVLLTGPQGCLIGILGPMRMDYSQAVSLMKRMKQLITN